MDGRENIGLVDSLPQRVSHTGRAMRALLLIGACVAGVAVVLGLTVFGGTDAKAAKPSLRIVHSKPIKVRGDHFRANEDIRVTAGKRTVRAMANGDGYFVITLPGSGRCGISRVLARGSGGSYVVVKLLPSPECLPARTG